MKWSYGIINSRSEVLKTFLLSTTENRLRMIVQRIAVKIQWLISKTFSVGHCARLPLLHWEIWVWRSNPAKNQLWHATFKLLSVKLKPQNKKFELCMFLLISGSIVSHKLWRSNPAKNQLWHATFKFNIQHLTFAFNIQLKLSTSDFGTQHLTLKWTSCAYKRCRIDNDINFQVTSLNISTPCQNATTNSIRVRLRFDFENQHGNGMI